MTLPTPRLLMCVITVSLLTGLAHAGPAEDIVAAYEVQAAKTAPGFVSDAARGRALYSKDFRLNTKLPNCAACHTQDPKAVGEHAISGKTIGPLAPAAYSKRFTDTAKVEKWFRRNCNDVLERECTAAEKADMSRYLISLK